MAPGRNGYAVSLMRTIVGLDLLPGGISTGRGYFIGKSRGCAPEP